MRALNQPIGWWGTFDREGQRPLSIVDLIAGGTLSPDLAAYLWQRLAAGASLIVAAWPPRAGKTTVLTALLAFLPPETPVYFTRGWGETFDLPPLNAAHPIYLLVNEISDHLPVYSWGPYARRAFALLPQGYALAATMHADTPEEVAAQLVYELAIPPEQVSRLDLCLTLAVERRDGRLYRYVHELAAFAADHGRLAARRLARRRGQGWEFHPEAEVDPPEQVRRADFLRRLLERGIRDPLAVAEALAQYPALEERGP